MTNTLFLFGMPGGYEWIIIGIIILLLFGGRKLPELMKGMGKGIKEFKDASKGDDDSKEIEEKK
jgi:sec-independent protein translocase protein TatA